MTPAAGALLNMLGSGVGLLQQVAGRRSSIEGASFDDLLKQARDGSLRSGEPIKLGTKADVELTPDQLERLGEAAATLEASGARRAVIMLDGMGIEYDIQTRTVIGRVDPENAGAVTGIDAYVNAPARAGENASLRAPAFGQPSNASLLKALGGSFSDDA